MREKGMWKMFTSQASEFYVAREIKHPHVLRMFDFFLQHRNEEDEFVIVSELCDATLNEIEFSMSAFLEYFLQASTLILRYDKFYRLRIFHEPVIIFRIGV